MHSRNLRAKMRRAWELRRLAEVGISGALVLTATLAALPVTSEAQGVPELSGYRLDHYRAPVPSSLAGASVIGIEEAYDFWQSGAAFIDVLPQEPKPAIVLEGMKWDAEPRLSIPGAIWLPSVGVGAVSNETEDYFRRGLAVATGDDPRRAVVFFCIEQCWMSWNAAKRAAEWGYETVYWLPEGTDGWARRGYPMRRIVPLEPQP